MVGTARRIGRAGEAAAGLGQLHFRGAMRGGVAGGPADAAATQARKLLGD